MRPIDADEFKRLIKSGDDLIFDTATERELCHMIDYQPTIEAEPVRHGQWIQTKLKGYYECSECRFEHSTNPNQRFCSYCGARMDATDTNVGGKGGADNAE
jgi:hypothetical protein